MIWKSFLALNILYATCYWDKASFFFFLVFWLYWEKILESLKNYRPNSSLRSCFENPVLTLTMWFSSRILEGFVILFHLALSVASGHQSCPELGCSFFLFSLLGFCDCLRQNSLWLFFFFLSVRENSVFQGNGGTGMVNKREYSKPS
jgi:hypothetical protein